VTILAFDTAQGALSAALVDERGNVLAHRFELRSRGHAEALAPMLHEVLAEAVISPRNLAALAVTIGPGTFTGLRAGLAMARGFALANTLPLIGITTLEAVAEAVTMQAGETLAVCFDARRGEIYLQFFGAALSPLSEPQLISLEEVAAIAPKTKLVLAGTGAELLSQLLPGQWRLAEASRQPDALAIARLGLRRLAANGRASYMKPPSPLYLRAPDAKLPGGKSL
jgi:tRNA threonylcarbamoyladenosine biosynthesis protein TsaB